MTIKDIYIGKNKITLDVRVKATFVFTSTMRFTFGYSLIFKGIVCIYVVRNMGKFTYSKCKVASLLWFAHFGMRIVDVLNY